MDYQSLLISAAEFGLVITQLQLDGQIHRTPTVNKPRSLNGWYVGDANSGRMLVGDWASGEQRVINSQGPKYSPIDIEAQRVELQRLRIEAEATRDKRQAAAADRAAALYDKARALVDEETAKSCGRSLAQSSLSSTLLHPYFIDKKIEPVLGVKQLGNQLVVPIYAGVAQDELINLQFIDVDGKKCFLRDGRVKGGCFGIGLSGFNGEGELIIAEGVATAASLYKLTQSPVVIAFNANNLILVAKQARQYWLQADMIIAADDDALTEMRTGINPGKLRGMQAAQLVNGRLSLPPFSEDERLAGLTDWNDYCSHNVNVGEVKHD